MEDYSPTPDEVEETPLKKRRFLKGNFLRSWLERRQDEDDSSGEKTKTDDKTKEQDWRPQRLRDRLRKIFNSLVGVETVSEVDSESLPNNPEQIEQDEDYEGLLAVSPDAQMRYYGYELMDEPGLEDQATAASRQRAEISDAETLEATVPEQGGTRIESGQTSRQPEQIGEVLRRRQTEKLEKRVKKLKKQTKTLKKEQTEMADKQKDFAERLAEKQKAQERFEKVTVPNMEKARQRLQQRLESQPQTAPPETKPTESIENSRPKLEVKTESQIEANARPEVKYEYAKPAAEMSPEELGQAKEQDRPHHITRERDFERKHEVKDQAGSAEPLYGASAGATFSRVSQKPLYDHSSASNVTDTPSQSPGSIPSYQPGTGMYKQAMKTGFWSGIGLTVLLLLVLILMR